MDLFLNWFDLKPGVSDVAFCDAVDAYLGPLKQRGEIAGYRLTRRKLAFGPAELGEFFLVIEVEGLAQLDRAFTTVSARAGPIEVGQNRREHVVEVVGDARDERADQLLPLCRTYLFRQEAPLGDVGDDAVADHRAADGPAAALRAHPPPFAARRFHAELGLEALLVRGVALRQLARGAEKEDDGTGMWMAHLIN